MNIDEIANIVINLCWSCNKEDVVIAKLGKSRKPTLKEIPYLLNSGTLWTEARGRKFRNKLHVAENDLLSITLTQLSKFEHSYFPLLNKVLKLTSKASKTDLEDLPINVVVLFQLMIVTYTLRSIFLWPQQKSDKDYVSLLKGLVFENISRLSKCLQDKLITIKIPNIGH